MNNATAARRWSQALMNNFGTPPIEGDTGWHLPGESAIVMRPVRDSETDG